MKITGGCYCGDVRYEADGEPAVMAQCHCRECQYLTGGAPNLFIAMPKEGYAITKGAAKAFQRSDLEKPVTREFCGNCGTHLLTRSPARPDAVIVKVGSMDDPKVFSPQIAIFTCDQQSFHDIADGVKSFDKRP